MVLTSLLRLRRRLLQARLEEGFGRVVDAAVVPRGQVVRLDQPRLSLVTKYVALAIDDPEPLAEEARTQLPALEDVTADASAEEKSTGPLAPSDSNTDERPKPSTTETQQAVDARAETRAGAKRRRARPARAVAMEAAPAQTPQAKTKHEPEPAAPAGPDVRSEPQPAAAQDNHRAKTTGAKESATQASPRRRRRPSGSKRSPAGARRLATKENDAKAAVEADARPVATADTPARTSDVNGKVSAQSCTIAVARDKGTARFYGRSFDVHGNQIVVAESPPFRYDGDGIPEEDAATSDAHRQLVESLHRRGWETSKKGWTWFALTLTRA